METDSLIAVNLINKNEVANHPDKTLIEDCKKLKRAMRLDLVHVYREGNKYTDYMSKFGKVRDKQTMRLIILTNELVQFLKVDMEGVVYSRGD